MMCTTSRFSVSPSMIIKTLLQYGTNLVLTTALHAVVSALARKLYMDIYHGYWLTGKTVGRLRTGLLDSFSVIRVGVGTVSSGLGGCPNEQNRLLLFCSFRGFCSFRKLVNKTLQTQSLTRFWGCFRFVHRFVVMYPEINFKGFCSFRHEPLTRFPSLLSQCIFISGY